MTGPLVPNPGAGVTKRRGAANLADVLRIVNIL